MLVFCNKGARVEALGAALRERGVLNVALTKAGDARLHGSNHHLDGFLRVRNAEKGECGKETEKTRRLLLLTLDDALI